MAPFGLNHCKHNLSVRNKQVNHKHNRFSKLLFSIMGFASLVWMLVRIIPKPSRAEYPCMKVAAPIASGFIAYVASSAVALLSFKKAQDYFRKSRYVLAAGLVLVMFGAAMLAILRTDSTTYASPAYKDSLFVPIDSPNTPMGTARGIYPGRVVWVRDSAAATWDGKTGYWWDDKYTHQANVDSMLSRSLCALTGESSDSASWIMLFKYFNKQHGRGEVGYAPGEKIAVKIDLNNSGGDYNVGNLTFTSPQSVLALLHQLVYRVGAADSDITVYDLIRYTPDCIYTKCKTEFPNMHFMGWLQENGRELYVRDTTIIHWSQPLTLQVGFGGSNPAYMPTAVTKAAYLINLASLKGHRYAGVSFCAKNHFGTLSCDTGGVPYIYAPFAAGVHPYITVHNIIYPGQPQYTFYGRPMGTYNALVDLMGHKDLGAKTVLFIIEGLYACQTEGDEISSKSKWLSPPFDNGWTSSMFVSQDNVAIESVCLDFFRAEAAINPNDTTIYGAVDNYLHEAALANNPPSGTYYAPNGDGVRLQSLGVHEHWNNSTDREYSRNLGTGDGVELVKLQSTVTAVRELSGPTDFALYSNYPNPFNPSTVISYRLAVRSSVSLKVFDVLGREVATLASGEEAAGSYQVRFDAGDLSSGVYFYRLQASRLSRGTPVIFSETKKLVLIK